MRTITLLIAAILLASPSAIAAETAASGGALATIQDYLDRAEDAIDNVAIGPMKLDVGFSMRCIYDDNIFLNDTNESNTEGRKDALIWETGLSLALVIPTNPDYVRWFDTDKVTVLSYRIAVQEYTNRGDMDNIAHSFRTNLFSFLDDLFKVEGEGANIYFHIKDDFDFITDPLDLEVRNLNAINLPIVKAVKELERWENRFTARVGYNGNMIFGFVGYDNEYYQFKDDLFESADHMEHTIRLRVGVHLPNMEEKDVYIEGRLRILDFRKRTLNDAEAFEIAAGFDGLIISRKLRVNAEVGYIQWNSSNNGATADDEDHHGAIAMLRAVFRPFADRKLTFQLEASRSIGWSAIANFRVDDQGALSVVYEVLPKKLEVDATVAMSNHNESDGPDRTLTEASVGVVYHLFTQVDVSLRYQYRIQNSWNELVILAGPGLVFASNGDFYQSVVSLGLDINFK